MKEILMLFFIFLFFCFADVLDKDLKRIASAIEAGTAETHSGSVHESAAPQEDAQ